MTLDGVPTLDELLASSMDAPAALLPLLPALVADLEDLGARAEDVLHVLHQVPHADLGAGRSVLDLGCGKGAAAIAIAKHRGAGVHGIDGIDEFVRHASARASALGLSRRCRFDAGDVRDAVTTERGHDLVMMLALGELLGDTADTIAALRACVVPRGHMLIDGAYVEPSCDDDALRELYPTRAQAIGELQRFGDRLVHECVVDGGDQAAHYRAVTDRLATRADELCALHPQAADAIREFVARQQQAADGLEGPVVGCLWLLQRA